MTERVEQRERERSRVWLPVRVRWDGGDAIAVTYDASDKGVLMLTTLAIPVGERVRLTFELPSASLDDLPAHPESGPQRPSGAPRERTGLGRVVRAAPNADDPHGLWPHRVAVALDEAMDAFATELSELAASHPLVDGHR
jgi:hypothetical protein